MSTKQLTERFGASGLKGGKAEEWLFDKLNHVYNDVIDLREDWKSQIDGIDFGIKKDSWHNTYYLDSKGNLNDMSFYLELSKNSEPGWFWKSKSDRIYHVDVKNNRAAWYSLPDMRRAISRLGLPLDKELVKIKANDIIYKNIIKWMY